MRRAIVLGLVFLVAAVTGAAAQPYGKPAPRPRPVWDSTGWTMLGERTVNGRVDRDRIPVGRYEGRFSKLTIVVLDSELEMLDFTINFMDRTTYTPKLTHYFREGQRTRAIDMPPNDGVIRNIDLKYRNLPGGGRARVQVWGLRVAAAQPPAPPPVRRVWDSTGWTMLGERIVNGRTDRDRIKVGKYQGRFSKLTVVVLDSDLEMINFQVNFGRGRAYNPPIQQYFRENSRTRVIDLPGDDRTIGSIDIRYRNLPGGGRARVQVWGFKTTNDPSPGRPQFSWDNRGWRMIGEQVVNGRIDKDRINVTYDEGKFKKLMLVVLDSDLELLELEVQFNRGAEWRPEVRQVFRENTRTRAIDLPGSRGRKIRWIDLKYRNLPGGGRARVQVWGR